MRRIRFWRCLCFPNVLRADVHYYPYLAIHLDRRLPVSGILVFVWRICNTKLMCAPLPWGILVRCGAMRTLLPSTCVTSWGTCVLSMCRSLRALSFSASVASWWPCVLSMCRRMRALLSSASVASRGSCCLQHVSRPEDPISSACFEWNIFIVPCLFAAAWVLQSLQISHVTHCGAFHLCMSVATSNKGYEPFTLWVWCALLPPGEHVDYQLVWI